MNQISCTEMYLQDLIQELMMKYSHTCWKHTSLETQGQMGEEEINWAKT